MEITKNPICKRHSSHFLFTNKKNRNVHIDIQNSWKFEKSKTISIITLHNFHEFFEIDIYIITKSMTLCVKWCLRTKTQIFFKKQDNSRYIFIYKNPGTLRYALFHWIFDTGVGRAFYKQKTMHFEFNFYMQKTTHFPLHFQIQKARHFASHFYRHKTMHFA